MYREQMSKAGVVDRVQVPGRPLGDSGWQSGGRGDRKLQAAPVAAGVRDCGVV